MLPRCGIFLIALLLACSDDDKSVPDADQGPDHYDCGYFRWCVDGVVYQRGPTSQDNGCAPDCTGLATPIFTCPAGCATGECEWTCDVSYLEDCGGVGDGSNLCAPVALTDGASLDR